MRDFDPYHIWLGIPPGEQPAHHYKLLGLVLFETDLEVIENAADARMRHVRTFQTGARAALSQTLLNELAAARICLLAPEKKQTYDAALRQRMAPAVAPPVAAPLAAVQSVVAQRQPAATGMDAAAHQFDDDFTSLTFPARRRHRSKRQSMLGQLAVLAALLVIICGSLAAYFKKPATAKSDSKAPHQSVTEPERSTPSKTDDPRPAPEPVKVEPVRVEFLSELEATTVQVHAAPSSPDWAMAGGVPSPHALWMHPKSAGFALRRYQLGPGFRSFTGTAAMRDALERASNSMVVFRIVGDNRLLWKSEPVNQKNRLQPANVDISGVETLELYVDCPGEYGWAQAMWHEPKISTEPVGGDSATLQPSTRLKVLEASYVVGDQRIDVTDWLQGYVLDNQLMGHRFDRMIGADPANTQQKRLTVRYRLDGREEQRDYSQQDFFAIHAPLKTIPADKRNGLVILAAGFGTGSVWLDTTEGVRAKVVNDHVDIANSDTLIAGKGGDVAFAIYKVNYVHYLLDGQERLEHFEGTKFSLGR